MKYMGSKRLMLQNGLGTVVRREAADCRRFFDLFAGTGAVAALVAKEFRIPVYAYDLQNYSAALSGAVLKRKAPLEWSSIWEAWHSRAAQCTERIDCPEACAVSRGSVESSRSWCAKQKGLPITKAYGGHYFSPRQALWIDAFRRTLPAREPDRTVALAALIQAASQCAAAPGHTAQPFQPTRTGIRFVRDAWSKDVVVKTRAALERLSSEHAKVIGRVGVANANRVAHRLRVGDLVFIDPPYSGVHYSRFYHVLETIARGACGEVSGAGRYPASVLRPRSQYSVSSESSSALEDLLRTIAHRGARAILTFPAHACSNGLSGGQVQSLAAKYFEVVSRRVKSNFSTLGGRGDNRKREAGRAARLSAKEMMLVLHPTVPA
jgi:adenine-specific DNA methylase